MRISTKIFQNLTASNSCRSTSSINELSLFVKATEESNNIHDEVKRIYTKM
jgi:hypothetical protein